MVAKPFRLRTKAKHAPVRASTKSESLHQERNRDDRDPVSRAERVFELVASRLAGPNGAVLPPAGAIFVICL
jgi:hypothetical protein